MRIKEPVPAEVCFRLAFSQISKCDVIQIHLQISSTCILRRWCLLPNHLCQWNNQVPLIEHFLNFEFFFWGASGQMEFAFITKVQRIICIASEYNSHDFETEDWKHLIHPDFFETQPGGNMLTPKIQLMQIIVKCSQQCWLLEYSQINSYVFSGLWRGDRQSQEDLSGQQPGSAT